MVQFLLAYFVQLDGIIGRLSGCPGYVGITVNSREDSEQLLRYDLLVVCPPLFNVTLKLPNWHQQTDKTFDLQLTDAKRTHLVFLTHITIDPITRGSFSSTILLTLCYSVSDLLW